MRAGFTTILVGLLMILPFGVVAGPDEGVFEPTSAGEGIVGFTEGQVPELAPGDRFAGHEVLQVEDRHDFIVVAADDLAVLRAAVLDDPRVAFVEDNARLQAGLVPDDSRYGSQYGPPMMGAEPAWDFTLGSSSIVVAVLDTGIQRDHPDFRPGSILQGHDYSNDDDDPADDCGHGTHVAGTVAAWTDNQRGVAGMSQATVLPMKVLAPSLTSCSGSISDISAAIRDSADQGADIISLSLGGGGFSSLMNSAVEYAYGRGVLVVAAAGNDGCEGCVNYPAAYENAIAVGAMTSSKGVAGYSSRGPQVEIAAPGSSIISTYNNGGYATLSGTSMAAPHVSGALALALSHAPGTGHEDLRRLMTETAEDLGAPGRDTGYGHGLLRVDDLVKSLVPGLAAPQNKAPEAFAAYDLGGRTVTFDAQGSDDLDDDPLTYAWTFGDGEDATGPVVTHTFPSAGTWNVTLVVDDGRGAATTLRSAVSVADGDWPDPDTAVTTLEPEVWHDLHIEEGETHFFKILVDQESQYLFTEVDGPACSISGILCGLDDAWDVRYDARPTDAEAACREDRQGGSQICVIDDPAKGWWFMRLTGQEGSADVQVRAFFEATPPQPLPDSAPVARWSYTPQGLSVGFNGSFSSDADGDALAYAWTLGDGHTSADSAFTHTYDAPGLYPVRLTVTDEGGSTSTLNGTLNLTFAEDNLAPSIALDVTTDGLGVHLDASGTTDPEGDAMTFAWDLGDGVQADGAVVDHDYAANGTYTVTLNVTDTAGAWNVTAFDVTVAERTDPDPSTPTVEDGETRIVTLAAGEEAHVKIHVADGTSSMLVEMEGPSCTVVLCPMDADLYVRYDARATDDAYDCRVDRSTASGSCLIGQPASGWWYVRVAAASGEGDVAVTIDLG